MIFSLIHQRRAPLGIDSFDAIEQERDIANLVPMPGDDALCSGAGDLPVFVRCLRLTSLKERARERELRRIDLALSRPGDASGEDDWSDGVMRFALVAAIGEIEGEDHALGAPALIENEFAQERVASLAGCNGERGDGDAVGHGRDF